MNLYSVTLFTFIHGSKGGLKMFQVIFFMIVALTLEIYENKYQRADPAFIFTHSSVTSRSEDEKGKEKSISHNLFVCILSFLASKLFVSQKKMRKKKEPY